MKNKDDGCHLHNSCLNCPEPICIYDFPGYTKSWEKFKEVHILLQNGLSIEEIVSRTGFSKGEVNKYYSKMLQFAVV